MNSKGLAPIILIVLVLVILFTAGIFIKKGGGDKIKETTKKATQVITGGGGFSVDENTPGYENYTKLIQGCPSKDCIPSIDKPEFESVNEANQWLKDDDIIFALDYKNETKAYPQRILNWHEIVNDIVAKEPLAITFCPLCGSSLAFDRRVDGQVLEFGVSGKLHNNDLIMYDRQTESLWQQITGEAIVGELFGKKLRQVSMDGMRWSQFKSEHPEGLVLSRETGFSRDYSRYPYGTYEQDTSVNFPIEGGVDQTIHPKTVVYGIEIDGKFKAYPEKKLEMEGEIKDEVGGVPMKVVLRNGDIFAENLKTGEEIVTTRLFWFAWKAFHPKTELY